MGMPGDLTHSCSGSPESVIKKALHALNEREAAVVPHEQTGMDAQKVFLQPSKPARRPRPCCNCYVISPSRHGVKLHHYYRYVYVELM